MLSFRVLILTLVCCMGMRGASALVLADTLYRTATAALGVPEQGTQPAGDTETPDPCDDEQPGPDLDQMHEAPFTPHALQLATVGVDDAVCENAGLLPPCLDSLVTLTRLRI